MKYMTEKETISFSETGICNTTDAKERKPLESGKEYLIDEIYFCESQNYGWIAHIEGASNCFKDGKSFYTTSKVLVSQLKQMMQKYGNGEGGTLSTIVSCSVVEKMSENGRRYLSFA